MTDRKIYVTYRLDKSSLISRYVVLGLFEEADDALHSACGEDVRVAYFYTPISDLQEAIAAWEEDGA